MPGRSSVPSATSAAFLRGAACHSRRGPKLYRPVRTGRCAMPRKRLGVRFCRMLRRITAVFRIRSRLSARCTSIQHYSSGETLPCVRQPGAIKTVFGGSHRRRVPARRSAPARPVARHRHAAQRRWPAPRVGGKGAMGDGAGIAAPRSTAAWTAAARYVPARSKFWQWRAAGGPGLGEEHRGDVDRPGLPLGQG